MMLLNRKGRCVQHLAIIGLFAFSTISLVGCGEDADSNSNSNSSSNDYEDRPAGSASMISDSQLDILVSAGIDVYLGDNPPGELPGTWLMDSPVITYDEQGLEGSSLSDAIFTFSDLTGDTIVTEWYQPSESGEAVGGGSFISGDDGCFTIYADSSGSQGDCVIESVDLYSGCVTSSDTIEGFQMSFMLLSKEGPESACNQVMNVESPRVINNTNPAHRVE